MEVGSSTGGKVVSRASHIVLAVVFVPLLVICLVSLGFFTAKSTDIAKNSLFGSKGYDGQYGTCILFATEDNDRPDPPLHLSSWKVCTFVIVGEAVLAFIAVVLAVIAVIKAVVGISPITVFALVELAITALSFLLGLSVGITISAGLATTCSAYDKASDDAGFDLSCPDHAAVPATDVRLIYFYDEINTAQVTAWVGVVYFLLLALFYLTLLVIYALRRAKRNEMTTYSTLHEERPPPYNENADESMRSVVGGVESDIKQ